MLGRDFARSLCSDPQASAPRSPHADLAPSSDPVPWSSGSELQESIGQPRKACPRPWNPRHWEECPITMALESSLELTGFQTTHHDTGRHYCIKSTNASTYLRVSQGNTHPPCVKCALMPCFMVSTIYTNASWNSLGGLHSSRRLCSTMSNTRLWCPFCEELQVPTRHPVQWCAPRSSHVLLPHHPGKEETAMPQDE